jgi:hypothetical protein
VELNRAEREYHWWPFWGLDGATPEITADAGDTWTEMELDADYEPDDFTPPEGLEVEDAEWHRILVAGPSAEGNPDGTVVIAKSGARLNFRIQSNPELIIEPGERIYLTR